MAAFSHPHTAYRVIQSHTKVLDFCRHLQLRGHMQKYSVCIVHQRHLQPLQPLQYLELVSEVSIQNQHLGFRVHKYITISIQHTNLIRSDPIFSSTRLTHPTPTISPPRIYSVYSNRSKTPPGMYAYICIMVQSTENGASHMSCTALSRMQMYVQTSWFPIL